MNPSKKESPLRSRRLVRYFWFTVSIIAGAALGIFIGWSRPVDTANAPPENLRGDYQLDIILMTAEIYQKDNDLTAAQRRLSYLNADEYIRLVQQAALDAHQFGYSTADLELIVSLSQALAKAGSEPSGALP